MLPPSATIDSPSNSDIYDVGELVVFQGTVSDGEDAVNTLQTTWTSNVDGELYSGVANSSGISAIVIGTTGGAQLTVGDGNSISLSALRNAHENWFPDFMAPV